MIPRCLRQTPEYYRVQQHSKSSYPDTSTCPRYLEVGSTVFNTCRDDGNSRKAEGNRETEVGAIVTGGDMDCEMETVKRGQ